MKLREEVKGVLGVIVLFIIALIGVVLLNQRLGNQKSVDTEVPTQYTNTYLNSK